MEANLTEPTSKIIVTPQGEVNMSEQQVTIKESPASWNTKYVDDTGFICMLTLRAESGQELLDKVDAALAHIMGEGAVPYSYGNGHKSPNSSHANSNGNGHNSDLCPIHGVEMKRYEKNGKSWHSHKTADGWCNGKAKKS